MERAAAVRSNRLPAFLWAAVVFAALMAMTRTLLFETYFIPSGSMVPTLQVGDRILVTRFANGLEVPWLGRLLPSFNPVDRGDVVVFRPPCTSEVKDRHGSCEVTYIKRVIGVPGDRLEMKHGQLLVNHTPVGAGAPQLALAPDLARECPSDSCVLASESIGNSTHEILRSVVPSLRSFGPVEVPEGYYFMMGDNRDNSRDSRAFGMVPARDILGEALWVWYSFDNASGDTRWDRVGVAIQ
jgi:signal peptidase I